MSSWSLAPMSWSALDSLLFDADGPRTALVLAPNYEARSALGPTELLRNRQIPSRVDVHLWTLRSAMAGVAPLENFKDDNIKAVRSALVSAGSSRLTTKTIPYPENFNSKRVARMLNQVVAPLPEEARLAIDISAMPRRMLAAIIQWRSEALERFVAVRSLIILYAWARKYAQYPSDEGDWRLLENDERLEQALDGVSGRKHCVVMCGRQGFDAASFTDTLGENLSPCAYVLLSNANLGHSFEVLRANLLTLRSRNVPVDYCLGIASGHERLMQWAATVPVEDNSAYMLAPFGPKPLVLSAILAADAIRARLDEAKVKAVVGVATLRGHRYDNVYSLGFAGWEALEFQSSHPAP